MLVPFLTSCLPGGEGSGEQEVALWDLAVGQAGKHLSSEERGPSGLVSGYCLSSSQLDAFYYAAAPIQYLIFLGKIK